MKQSTALDLTMFLFCAILGCIAYVVYWLQLIAPPLVISDDASLRRYTVIRTETERTGRGVTSDFLVLSRNGRSNRFLVPRDCFGYVDALPFDAEIDASTSNGTICQVYLNGRDLINYDEVNQKRSTNRLIVLAIMGLLSLPFTVMALVDIFRFCRWLLNPKRASSINS